jgi:hypothetical protein
MVASTTMLSGSRKHQHSPAVSCAPGPYKVVDRPRADGARARMETTFPSLREPLTLHGPNHIGDAAESGATLQCSGPPRVADVGMGFGIVA